MPAPAALTVDPALERRLRGHLASHRRVVLGIAGPPGGGKSTLADALVELVDPERRRAVRVPMDGFHLADAELDRTGLRDRKGAPETFDAHGYLALLRRLANESATVYAPAFDREIEQPIAGSIPVLPEARLVVTEGNYLLDDEHPWSVVRTLLTEVWFCDVGPGTRRARLVARHVMHGKSADAARAWVERVDEPNAARVRSGRRHAACVVTDGRLVEPREPADSDRRS